MCDGHDIAIIGRDRWGRCIECSKIAGRNPSKERKEKKQAYQRWWNEKNKEKIKKQRKLNNRLQRLKRYNLTPEKYDAMLKAQKGLCAGCLQDSKNDRIPLAIDHDHVCCPEFKSCGKCIRGLLCYQCNSVLGYIKDDVNVLKRLIKYLNKNKEK